MRTLRCSLLALAVSTTMAAAQPCTPELVEVGGTTPCGALGRVDALAVHKVEGVPRLFALVRSQPNDATEEIRPSGVGMWSPEGWTWRVSFYNEFARYSSMLSVPGEDTSRLFVVGLPTRESPFQYMWWLDERGQWGGGGFIEALSIQPEVSPALVRSPHSDGTTILVGGSFGGEVLLGCDRYTCRSNERSRLGGLPTSHLRTFDYYAPPGGGAPALYAGGVDLSMRGDTLAIFQDGAWGFVPFEAQGPITGLKSHAGSLWITTPRGLYRYDGAVFHALPPLAGIECLEWFDDGTGERLYAGGSFNLDPGSPMAQVVRFDGAAWQRVGNSFSDPDVEPVVKSLVTFDFGQGPRLVAGGQFQRIGLKLLNNMAAWDGESWKATGNSDHLFAATYHDDGHGHEVHMLGWSNRDVWYQPQNRVMRLRDGELEILGDDFPRGCYIYRIYSFDLGSGPQLYAVGDFSSAPGGVPAAGIARWDGERWHGLGDQVPGQTAEVRGAAVYDEDGPGPLPRSLYVTGAFTGMGSTPALNIARWDGNQWHAVGGGLEHWGGQIIARQGSGVNELVVIKSHPVMGTELATWNGDQWTSNPGGHFGERNEGNTIAVADIGSGPDVFSAHTYFWLHRWGGSNWSTVPHASLGIAPIAIAAIDDGAGPAVFISGWLTGWRGAVVRWDGHSSQTIFESPREPRNITATFDGTRRGILITQSVFATGAVFYRGCPACPNSDFNNDSDFGTDSDILDFFACLSGNCCTTCGTADFNNDGDLGTDADIEMFFRVLSGGGC